MNNAVVMVDGTTIQLVRDYKYSGITIAYDGTLDSN